MQMATALAVGSTEQGVIVTHRDGSRHDVTVLPLWTRLCLVMFPVIILLPNPAYGRPAPETSGILSIMVWMIPRFSSVDQLYTRRRPPTPYYCLPTVLVHFAHSLRCTS